MTKAKTPKQIAIKIKSIKKQATNYKELKRKQQQKRLRKKRR